MSKRQRGTRRPSTASLHRPIDVRHHERRPTGRAGAGPADRGHRRRRQRATGLTARSSGRLHGHQPLGSPTGTDAGGCATQVATRAVPLAAADRFCRAWRRDHRGRLLQLRERGSVRVPVPAHAGANGHAAHRTVRPPVSPHRRRRPPSPSPSPSPVARAPPVGLAGSIGVAGRLGRPHPLPVAVAVAARPSPTLRLGFPTKDLGRTHVANGSTITYEFCPPTSGNHYAQIGQAPRLVFRRRSIRRAPPSGRATGSTTWSTATW